MDCVGRSGKLKNQNILKKENVINNDYNYIKIKKEIEIKIKNKNKMILINSK